MNLDTDKQTKEWLLKGFLFIFALSLFSIVISLVVIHYIFELSVIDLFSSVTGVWNFLLGVPVTAAGAVIAILLAKKAIDISTSQEKLEAKNLELNTRLAEYEFKQSLTKKWETAISIYSDFNADIENLSEALKSLGSWHQSPKNHLSFFGSELSLTVKGDVQGAIDTYSKSIESPEELKQTVMSAFNSYDCASLKISQGKLKFDSEKNKELAAKHNEGFYKLVKNDVTQALIQIEKTLLRFNKCSFTAELWKSKYQVLSKNDNFMLSKTLEHIETNNKYQIPSPERHKFSSCVLSTPLSAVERIRKFRLNLESPSHLTRLFLLTANRSDTNELYENILSLLDYTRYHKQGELPQGSQFHSVYFEEDFEEPLTPEVFWDELEPFCLAQSKSWVSSARLFFIDLIRMMPTEKDVLLWGQAHFDLTKNTQDWILDNLSFDCKLIFELNLNLVPSFLDGFLNQIDISDEDHQIALLHSALGWNGRFAHTDRYVDFLDLVFDAYVRGNVSYKTNVDITSLQEIGYATQWKMRQPKNYQEQETIRYFKEAEEYEREREEYEYTQYDDLTDEELEEILAEDLKFESIDDVLSDEYLSIKNISDGSVI